MLSASACPRLRRTVTHRVIQTFSPHAVIGIIFIVNAFNDGRGAKIGAHHAHPSDCKRSLCAALFLWPPRSLSCATRSAAPAEQFQAVANAWSEVHRAEFETTEALGWTYNVTSDCSDGLTDQALALKQPVEDLGAEKEEATIFAAYEGLAFTDEMPATPDTSTAVVSCVVQFAFNLGGQEVRPPLTPHPLMCSACISAVNCLVRSAEPRPQQCASCRCPAPRM